MSGWLARLLPAQADNRYAGAPVAYYALWLATAATLWRSLHHLLAADGGARSIATIPLERYPPSAAANLVAIFAQWGLSQLLLGVVMLVVALRYRALVPLMWLVLVGEYAGRQLAGMAKPLDTLARAPGAVLNLPVLAVAVVMLALSLRAPR
ncbi:MAG: hypothetical protein JSS36_04965 [Proteobacteria bacterium]|nr:hypothetical protein [Pseudomonadota bacterium]